VSDGAKADETEHEELEESLPEEEALDCPIDIYIIYYGLSHYLASNLPLHKFPSKQKDSLYHHLIDFHLARAHKGISYT
jgi:hypothetical protein